MAIVVTEVYWQAFTLLTATIGNGISILHPILFEPKSLDLYRNLAVNPIAMFGLFTGITFILGMSVNIILR